MAIVTVTTYMDLTNQWLDYVDGCVCVNGSKLVKTGHNTAVLTYGLPIRQQVTPQEAATFVRNFLDEGFDERIQITN